MDVTAAIKFGLLLIINFVTLTGNLLMIIAGIKSKKLRKYQNAFIFNMATADLLHAIIIMPSALVSIYFSEWVFSKDLCQVFAVIKVTLTMTSAYSLSGISLQRYFFVVRRTKRMNSIRSAIIGIVCVWSLSIILSITPLVGWGKLGFEKGKDVCTILFHSSLSHTLTLAITGLMINIAIMVICYYFIYRELRKNKLKMKKMDISIETSFSATMSDSFEESNVEDSTNRPSAPNKLSVEAAHRQSSFKTLRNWVARSISQTKRTVIINRRELRLLQTISIVIAVFIICWTPYALFTILRTTGVVGNNDDVDTVTMWLGFLNSAANPLIYGVLNRQFRAEMKKIFVK